MAGFIDVELADRGVSNNFARCKAALDSEAKCLQPKRHRTADVSASFLPNVLKP